MAPSTAAANSPAVRPGLAGSGVNGGFISLVFCLLSSCGGRDEWDPDRQTLLVAVTDGPTLHEHPCEEARDAELLAYTYLPQLHRDALHKRIETAQLADVRACLEQVRAYDRCFLTLSCNAFAEPQYPAWLGGGEHAPCGCGVDDRSPGPFAHGFLPDSLADCTGILPVTTFPSRPGAGESCAD